jgi:hypothetical protein
MPIQPCNFSEGSELMILMVSNETVITCPMSRSM